MESLVIDDISLTQDQINAITDFYIAMVGRLRSFQCSLSCTSLNPSLKNEDNPDGRSPLSVIELFKPLPWLTPSHNYSYFRLPPEQRNRPENEEEENEYPRPQYSHLTTTEDIMDSILSRIPRYWTVKEWNLFLDRLQLTQPQYWHHFIHKSTSIWRQGINFINLCQDDVLHDAIFPRIESRVWESDLTTTDDLTYLVFHFFFQKCVKTLDWFWSQISKVDAVNVLSNAIIKMLYPSPGTLRFEHEVRRAGHEEEDFYYRSDLPTYICNFIVANGMAEHVVRVLFGTMNNISTPKLITAKTPLRKLLIVQRFRKIVRYHNVFLGSLNRLSDSTMTPVSMALSVIMRSLFSATSYTVLQWTYVMRLGLDSKEIKGFNRYWDALMVQWHYITNDDITAISEGGQPVRYPGHSIDDRFALLMRPLAIQEEDEDDEEEDDDDDDDVAAARRYREIRDHSKKWGINLRKLEDGFFHHLEPITSQNGAQVIACNQLSQMATALTMLMIGANQQHLKKYIVATNMGSQYTGMNRYIGHYFETFFNDYGYKQHITSTIIFVTLGTNQPCFPFVQEWFYLKNVAHIVRYTWTSRKVNALATFYSTNTVDGFIADLIDMDLKGNTSISASERRRAYVDEYDKPSLTSLITESILDACYTRQLACRIEAWYKLLIPHISTTPPTSFPWNDRVMLFIWYQTMLNFKILTPMVDAAAALPAGAPFAITISKTPVDRNLIYKCAIPPSPATSLMRLFNIDIWDEGKCAMFLHLFLYNAEVFNILEMLWRYQFQFTYRDVYRFNFIIEHMKQREPEQHVYSHVYRSMLAENRLEMEQIQTNLLNVYNPCLLSPNTLMTFYDNNNQETTTTTTMMMTKQLPYCYAEGVKAIFESLLLWLPKELCAIIAHMWISKTFKTYKDIERNKTLVKCWKKWHDTVNGKYDGFKFHPPPENINSQTLLYFEYARTNSGEKWL